MWRWLWWWAGGSNSDLLVAVLTEVGAKLEVKTEVIERGTGGRATAAGDVEICLYSDLSNIGKRRSE